jgi:hypothetical protein
LGERIVRELGLEDEVDTLSRWMAHRIAELLTDAKQARRKTDREASERRAEELVLAVWERRSSWPRGWPPPNAAGALEALSVAEYPLQEQKPTGSRWWDRVRALRRIHAEEVEAWIDAGMLERGADEERAVVDEPVGMTDDELKWIQHYVSRHERAVTAFERSQQGEGRAEPDRQGETPSEYAVARLLHLQHDREELLAEVLAAEFDAPSEPRPARRSRRRRRERGSK